MTVLVPLHFCHSGAGRRPEPGIQKQSLCLHLDSGFALSARPGMTRGGEA
jgi:hypothetical protein